MAQNFLTTVVRPELIKPRLQGTDKDAIIRELIDVLVSAGAISDRGAAEKAVFDREKTMSTGMENGIAIPHGKTDTVDSLIAAIGLKPEGVDFQCVDGQPARILILTLSPANHSGPHVRFMAGISKLLRDEEAHARLLEADTSDAVFNVLTAPKS